MNSKRNQCAFLAITVFLAICGTPAEASTLDELALMGEEAMTAGNYAEAIRHYERITEIGPTYESLMAVQFDLGWCYYLTGQPAKAIPLFESLSGPRSPSEAVRQQSLFLLAECHARKGGDQPEGSAERKKAVDTAIELHTKFQDEYPKNPNAPQSLYGRAYAYYLDRQMDRAESDLKKVINDHPATQVARDATFLLASVYSAQGLEKIKAGDRSAAEQYIDKARELFSDLSALEGVNLGTANDSVFSLGETWFAAGEYLQAIRYYQRIRSQKEVARNVERLQEQMQDRLMEQLRKQEDPSRTRTTIDRLRVQVRDLRRAPDMMISGYFRIADAFYRIERYDEVRVICRHLMDFVDDEGRQQAAYMVINAYLQENNADAAARELEDFQTTFGYDIAMVDTVAMSIGQIYLAQGDMEKALEFLNKSASEHPEGRSAEDALYLKFAAEYMDQKHENTLATTAEYMEKYPKGKYLPNALYYKATSQAALRQWEDALTTINTVLEQFPKGTEEFTNIDEAFYQKGWMLNESGKPEEAAKHLSEFVSRFPDSTLLPEGMYQLGFALNASDESEKAQDTLRSIVEKFPDHYIAAPALYQIAVQHFEKEDFPAMEKALTVVIESYPDNPLVVESYFWQGWIAMQDNRHDEAIELLNKSLELNPSHLLAPENIRLIAQSYGSKAEKMGLPTVLGEDQRTVYKKTVLRAAEEFERLMVEYPNSHQMLEAVPGISDSIYDLVRYRQMDETEALKYFDDGMARHSGNPNAMALWSYGKGSFLMKIRNREDALRAFRHALSTYPGLRVSPVLLAEYAEALKDAGELSEAESIYTKIIDDHGDDPLVLAPAWYGLANIKYLENNFEEAKELFEMVLQDFEWYEEGRQGRVMLARILEQNEQYAEAEKMFEEVWRQETGLARLGAMLGVARCQLKQAEIAKKERKADAWRENIRVADQNLTRIIVMFEAYPESVAEALWLKGNAYELVDDREKARETYSRLVLDEEYRHMPWTSQARERLNKIGGVLAPASS